MNPYRFFLVLCRAALFFTCLTSVALAQRIPDLSLSPEETAKQPNISYGKPDPSFQNDVLRRSITTAPPLPGQGMKQAKRFMDGYCDPNFIPLLANNRKYFGQEQCLQALRDDSCARFDSLPQDVKDMLDAAISCMFTNGNSYVAANAMTSDDDAIACGVSYARRLDMLKKYSADPYTTYALIYLPDNVLDTDGRCVNRK